MKLGIIIPLKSRKVSSDWKTVCNSLESTLTSIKNQSRNNYNVMVVGHEEPDFLRAFYSETFGFHSIKEIPPPTKKNNTKITQEQYTSDKNMKIAKAIELLKKKDKTISHWFALDADDLIHKDFIKIFLKSNIKAGAIINHGYLYYINSQRLLECNELSLYCGSTGIISDEYINCPSNIDINTIKNIPFCRYPHMHLDQFFSNEVKKPYTEIEEKVIIYVLSNGENISDGYRNNWLSQCKAYLKPYIKGKKISLKIKSSFSLL